MDSPSYDFWLLDLDGTLVDIEPDYLQSVMAEVGDRVGYSFDEREAEVLWHGLGGSRNEQLAAWGLDPEPFWEAFHAVENAERRADHAFLYDDAEWVGDLDRPVGLVTHSQQHLSDAVLDRLDIRDWFDAVVCCTDDLGWKPDPAPMRRAMRDLGVAAGDDPIGHGIMVGDSPQDVGAAWNVGLDGAHVERHGHDHRGMCVLADHRLTRLDELWDRPTAGRAGDPVGDELPGGFVGSGDPPAMD